MAQEIFLLYIEAEMSSSRLVLWSLAPHLVMLLGDAVENFRDRASKAEVGHWRKDMDSCLVPAFHLLV